LWTPHWRSNACSVASTALYGVFGFHREDETQYKVTEKSSSGIEIQKVYELQKVPRLY